MKFEISIEKIMFSGCRIGSIIHSQENGEPLLVEKRVKKPAKKILAIQGRARDTRRKRHQELMIFDKTLKQLSLEPFLTKK